MSDSSMNDVDELVERIHAAPPLVVVAATGAGSQALAWLLAVPGASRTLLEALVPYAATSMVDLIGEEPGEFVSAETALAMARASHRRALDLRDGEAPVIGVACTATIATDRTKRGKHRCAVATSSGSEDGERVYTLTLSKGSRDRAGEEEVVSRLLLHALALASGVESTLSLGLLADERLETQSP